MKEKQLTDKQLRFVELYNGNATETALLCGYKSPREAGTRCMRDVAICRLIQVKRSNELVDGIADRQKLQKLWSELAFDKEEQTRDRLKASEHLAKSQGLFLDRVQHSGDKENPVQVSINVKYVNTLEG